MRLLGITEDGNLRVGGADLMNGTPIYDIKPYIPYADCRPQAVGSFAGEAPAVKAVALPAEMLPEGFPAEKLDALRGVLAQDPRPRYHSDPERVYGLDFAGYNVRFRVADGSVTVLSVE